MNYSKFESIEEKDTYLTKVNKDAKEIDESGLPIYYEDDNVYINPKLKHVISVGNHESGLSQLVTLPLIDVIAKSNESLVVSDPTGEVYKKSITLLKYSGYCIYSLDFNNLDYGNNWNPLLEAYNFYKAGDIDTAIELVENISECFISDEKESNDPFWIMSARRVFFGLVLYLFDNATSEYINLLSISNLVSKAFNRDDALFEKVKNYDKSHPISNYLNNMFDYPSETFLSILTTLDQKLKKYTSKEKLINMLSTSDFTIEDFFETKSALYITNSMANNYPELTTLLISTIYMLKRKHNNTDKLNVLIEDFDKILPIKNTTAMLINSFGIKFYLNVDSFETLENIYGKENRYIIEANMGNIVYLLSNSIKSLEYISSLCGKKDSDVDLVSVEDLQRLKYGQALIIQVRHYPIFTELKEYVNQYEDDIELTRDNKEYKIFE